MNGEKNKIYTIEELIFNDKFRSWVLTNDHTSKLFWDDYVKKNPEKIKEIAEAKEILLASNYYFSNKEKSNETSDLVDQILKETINKPKVIRLKSTNIRKIMGVAAIFLAVICAYKYFPTGGNKIDERLVKSILVNSNSSKILFYKNDTNKPRLVILNDGSSILLGSKSQLKVPEQFESQTRTIFLDGSAYFEVAKRPYQPMKIYSQEFSVEVVGTRFTIDTKAKNKTSVGVYNGAVKIFESKLRSDTNPYSQIAIANQQWSIKDRKIDELDKIENVPTFYYESVDVTQVFKEIDEFYGTTTNWTINKSKKLTANLSDETLNRKIELISNALDLSIDLKNNIIIIR